MKKYIRRIPLISTLKIAMVALYAAIATALTFAFCGVESGWFIVCGGIFVTLVATFLFTFMAVRHKYSYSDNCIRLLYLSIGYRKIKYPNFSSIYISNASYNNGYGYGVYTNIPMQYKSKEKTAIIKMTYPFITLHKPEYPIYKIKAGMSSRDLFMLDNQEIYCLGICWFDSLSELLDHTDSLVYVLEDVYLRFKVEFDIIFLHHEQEIDRFYIITDHSVDYKDYWRNK